MPIIASEVQTRFSGGAANASASASLGGVMSSTAWAGGSLHDLFDPISGTENTNQTVDYRCIYVRNGNGSLQAQAVSVYMSAEVAGGANVAIGLDPAGNGDGSTTGVATTIANETAVPTGVAFTSPTTRAGGLSIGGLNAGQARAVWIRRTATNSAAINADGFTLTVALDTAA